MGDASAQTRAQFLCDIDTMDELQLAGLDAALGGSADETEAPLRRAFIALRRGHLAAAQGYLLAVSETGNDPWTAFVAASVEIREGKYEDALAHARIASAEDVLAPDAAMLRAVALSNLAEHTELLAEHDDPRWEDNIRGSLCALKAYAAQMAGDLELARTLLSAARRFIPDLVGYRERLAQLQGGPSSDDAALRCVRI